MAEKGFWDEVLDFLGAAAPALATALGGPLAGTATKFIADQLLGNDAATEDQVKTALLGASPDILIRVKELDTQFREKMQQAGVDMARMQIDQELAYLKDTQDARAVFGKDQGVFWMGVAILMIFVLFTGMILTGCYLMLTSMSEQVTKLEAGIFATVTGIVGTIYGAVAANSQTVVNFFFGSSQGSVQKTGAIGDAIARLGTPAPGRPAGGKTSR